MQVQQTTQNQEMTAYSGDIVLYNDKNIVLFYGSNTWSYTSIGHINLPEKEIKELFNKLGLESKLSKLGVTEDKLSDMAVKATENCGGVLHSITTLTTKDVENIFRMCM